MGAWENLSMREKAEMMKVAVRNGVTTLPEIRQAYNEFAGGGNKQTSKQMFLDSLEQSIKEDNRFDSLGWRRFFTDLAKQESSYRPDATNSIGAKGYFQLMPANRSKTWNNSTQQFHEMYKLTKNNLDYLNKKLTKADWEKAKALGIDMYGLLAGAHLGGVGNTLKALRGTGNAKDMNGSSMLGYMTKFSQGNSSTPIVTQEDTATPPVFFRPYNEHAFYGLSQYEPTTTILEPEQPLAQATIDNAYTQAELDRQERRDRLDRFNMLMSLSSPQQDNGMLGAIGMLSGLGTTNAYGEGGDIYIKPKNRGKFTALKERTGHSATWFKEHGTPAQKKMAIFALNSRHWKHSLGGNLYDGTSQPSQQMDRPNIFRYDDGRYVYQAAPDAEEIEVSPINTLLPNPSQWTYQDASGKIYTPHAAQTDTGSITQGEESNPLVRAANNYFREAAWRAKDGSLALQGKYTMPAIAASALLPVAGEAAYPLLTNPYVDAAATSAFAGHGLNHAINEGVNGWGDAAMTALEVVPLGRLVKPMWNAAKSIRNFIPTSESNMSGVRYAYDRNPELANIGTLEDYNDYLKTVFPESKVKDINYHMGPKGLQELKPSTGEVYNTNPDARGIYVTPDKSYAQKLRKYTTSRLENPSFFTYIKRNLTPGGWDKANEAFTDIYPVMVDTKNPLLTKGDWTWGIKDKKYQSLMDDYDAIVNSGPKWYQNFNSMPETIVPKTEQSLILGSDADVAGFRRFMSNSQITAENEPLFARDPSSYFAPYQDYITLQNRAEAGRQDLIDDITSEWRRQRMRNAGISEDNIDKIVTRQKELAEEVPFDYSKTTKEINGLGVTSPRPFNQYTLPNGVRVNDYNTGLDVSIAKDMSSMARRTGYHESGHYSLSSALGTQSGDYIVNPSDPVFSPIAHNYTPSNSTTITRGESWQHQLIDYNQSLLPPNDPYYETIMDWKYDIRKDAAAVKEKLKRAGATEKQADKIIADVKDADYMWNTQEQDRNLKEFFHYDIKPLLKNPNDELEIEKVLTDNPDIINNNYYIKQLMTKLRPGTIKDYAKVLARMLSTLPAVNTLSNNKKQE